MRIIKKGILDTIQDIGRYGYQYLGINPGGVMDKYAMQVTNALVGNDLNEAVIEMHFPAAAFIFTQAAIIAIGGANFSPTINGEAIPDYHPIIVNKNDILQFDRPVSGACVYVAVAGGISINKWMNSRSTNLKAKAGGFHGRKLQKEDHLLLRMAFPFDATVNEFTVLPWQADLKWLHEITSSDPILLDILPGNEWSYLSEESKERMVTASFEISQQSDRMGYRLNNVPFTKNITEEVISSGVSFGTIQLLPDGKLIVLMADHQTTGGYPRVAHIVTAHHSALAQLKAGDVLKFQLTNQQKAEELYIKQQQHLLQLQNACTFRLQEYFK